MFTLLHLGNSLIFSRDEDPPLHSSQAGLHETAKFENQYDSYYSHTASELPGTEHKKESRVLR